MSFITSSSSSLSSPLLSPSSLPPLFSIPSSFLIPHFSFFSSPLFYSFLHFSTSALPLLYPPSLSPPSPLPSLSLPSLSSTLPYSSLCSYCLPQGPSLLTLTEQVHIALDVAKGCRYLEQQHFIHRDIAARNCLVSSKGADRVVKIGGVLWKLMMIKHN